MPRLALPAATPAVVSGVRRWHDRGAMGMVTIATLCLVVALLTGEAVDRSLLNWGAAVLLTTLVWAVVRNRRVAPLLRVWPLLLFVCFALGSFLVPVSAPLTLDVMVVGFMYAGMTQPIGASLFMLPPALLAQWLVIDLPAGQAATQMSISAVVWMAVAELPAWLTSSLRHARRSLAREAATDALTGLANRRAWEPLLTELMRHARSAARPVTLLLIDLDHFKAYNDQHGHLAGDDLLRRFAADIAAVLPYSATAARWGGEEFVVALPGLSPAEATHVAERIRAVVPDGQSCSIGLATSRPDDTELTLLGRADAALYRAKDGGRDRVEAAAS